MRISCFFTQKQGEQIIRVTAKRSAQAKLQANIELKGKDSTYLRKGTTVMVGQP